MTLSNENKIDYAVVPANIESICPRCAFNGCGECPSRKTGSDDVMSDYPFITDGIQTMHGILVLSCDNFLAKSKTKLQVLTKPKYVFNNKTKRFEKK